jgi:hypothetical protein
MMSDFLNDMQCDELVDGQYFDGQYVPTEQDLADMNEAWDNELPDNENFFCANCGHVELVGYALSPDSSLCCDCYQYNRDDDCDDYIETEADVYQDSSYDDEPNGWSDHLEGYECD